MEAAPLVHPVSVLRAPHSQWYPEPSPPVGDERTQLVLGRYLEITLRPLPECSGTLHICCLIKFGGGVLPIPDTSSQLGSGL